MYFADRKEISNEQLFRMLTSLFALSTPLLG
jgi:hypothetical protein